MRLILLFFACLVPVVVACFICGLVTGYMPSLFPILILTTILAAKVNNRLESRRVKKELEREGLG
jgi:1,4-dihydroxy-2-naphthoate octaprenyltransferase